MAGGTSALDDRRQRAREEFYQGMPARRTESVPTALDRAIESATQVRITLQMIDAVWTHVDFVNHGTEGIREGLRAALEAAGFEVVEPPGR
jgi:hypothetical protein